ncbi:hypothetical protein [Pantoea ananatis]|uniref:hypothetical protein n=1 Tax=Pantoea ananas TaxID=553 RepID=UPI0002F141F5|nr:hypothetical protein [Pantoea ananatis]PQK94641.1 hypothetical protein CG434_22530 [Pantoea ananatis]
MKIRLLTALITTACLSQAASADDLTSGSITNQTTATADVEFNQPVTLVNTLTPVNGIKAGAASGANNPVEIATGKLAIKEAGVTAQLALKSAGADQVPLITYAKGHQGEPAYALTYQPAIIDVSPNQAGPSGYNFFTASDGVYTVTTEKESELTYSVLGLGSGNALPGAGTYTISMTGAVYNP